MQTEVCVIGGGPAGATVARRLAQLGHSVTLVEGSASPRRRIGESLPPSILPVLEALGLRSAIETAGFARPTGSTIRWSSEHTQHRSFDAQPGFHVDRGRFDALLRDAAARSGVGMLQPMRAGRPWRAARGWVVPASGDGGEATIRARALVDASGRRPRRGAGPRTLAVWGNWNGAAQHADRRSCVEAARDGWYWGAPLPDGSLNAAMFVDVAAGAAKRYRDHLAGSALLRHCLGGVLDGGVHACDATPYVDDDPISRDHLRVGDASYTIDPLSSQGVQHALSSALQGAVALHTILMSPADADAAIEFYRARQASAAAAAARACGELYAQVERFDGQPFWRRRAKTAQPATAFAAPLHPLADDRALRLADGVRVVDTPVLMGDRIRRIPALHHPLLDRPAAFLGAVALTPLVGQIRDGCTAGDLARRWPLPPHVSRHVIDWLRHAGLLQERQEMPGRAPPPARYDPIAATGPVNVPP